MATPTYVPLGTLVLPSTATSVTFSSIPATYRDLIILIGGGITAGLPARGVEYFYNSDFTLSNYASVDMYGWSSGTGSGSGARQGFGMAGSANSVALQIMDYAQTNKHKTSLVRFDANGGETGAAAGRWANTSAITSITIQDSILGFTFTAGSTFSMYGVA